MRITNTILANTLRINLATTADHVAKRLEEVITGRRLNKPSDDPVDTLAALNVRYELANNQQYQRNIARAQSVLNGTEIVVTNILERITDAWELAVQMANDTYSPEDRATTAYQLDQMIENLLSLANTRTGGKYIFAGTQDTYAPYVAETDKNGNITGILTTGSRGDKDFAIGEGILVRVNVKGEEFLDAGNNIFDVFIEFRDALRAGDGDDVRDVINKLDACMNQVINTQSVIGARATRLEAAENRMLDDELNLNKLVSNIEDIDIAGAISNLELEQLVYQVALRAGADIIQPTLASFLR